VKDMDGAESVQTNKRNSKSDRRRVTDWDVGWSFAQKMHDEEERG
jgi:hypothetical protein